MQVKTFKEIRKTTIAVMISVVVVFAFFAASMLALYMGAWCLQQGRPMVWAAASFASFVALGAYLIWFLRKSKDLR